MMRSPFPGMDPHIERRWGDFHAGVTTYIRDTLQPRLPSGLRARMEERVYVESLDGLQRQVIPDVHVHQIPPRQQSMPRSVTPEGGVAIAEPILVRVPVEVTERSVQIIDSDSGGTVVTVIELLSPANKLSGRGRTQYLQKQQEYLEGHVNLVEIDLVRVGQHTSLAKLDLIPAEKITTYHVSTFRAVRPNLLEYYPLALRLRLPRLPIPLRAGDSDVLLDLQEVVDTAYERGRYDDIDYSRPLQPPLHPADQQWAAELIASRQ